MSASRLDAIRQELENELELAEAEAGRLKTELAAADKDVKAIKDALTALGRKPGQPTKKPALKKVEVIKAITSLLKNATDPVSHDALEAALSEHASKNGKSATGLKLRMNESLAGEEFTVTEHGISLTAKTPIQ